MKTRNTISLFALVLTLTTSLCMSMGSLDRYLPKPEAPAPAPSSITASVPVAVESAAVQAPSSLTDDLVAAGTFVRPAIAVGANGVIHVAAEGAAMQSVHLFTRNSSGTWTGGIIAKSEKGGVCDASRVYVPDAVADADGWCWVSMRCGPKEWGKLHGPAIYVRSPSGAGAWRFLGLTTGAARLGLDSSMPGRAVLLTKNGDWGAIDRSGAVTRTGNYPAGETGEKFDLDIVGTTWASAHNGYSGQSSACTIGTASGGPRQTWATHLAYPSQGNDLNYPSVCIERSPPMRVYAAAVYAGALRVQVFKAGKARYPADKLPSLDAATQEDRCPPRLIATPKAVLAVYVKSGSIYRVNVEQRLKGKATPTKICAGANPAVCIDTAGTLHLAYIGAGGLRYRTVNLQE